MGTGLGPTLEFYALVSAELQRSDLGLWNGSDSYKQNSANIVDVVKSTSATLHIDESQDANSQSGDNNITTNTNTTATSPNTASTRNSSRNNRDSHGVATRSSLVATNNSINNQQQQQQHSPQAGEDALDMLIEQQGDLIDQQHSLQDPSMPLLDNPIAVTTHTPSQQQSANAPHHVTVTYVNAAHGLFPLPLGKSSKLPHVSKVKSKFKFLGKFMAKAVMDSRMVSLFKFYIKK